MNKISVKAWFVLSIYLVSFGFIGVMIYTLILIEIYEKVLIVEYNIILRICEIILGVYGISGLLYLMNEKIRDLGKERKINE